MSRPSNLQALVLADEASFGESSSTFDERLPIIGPVDVTGLEQDRIPAGRTKQYQNDDEFGFRGPQSGSFSFSMYLSGLGAATTGAVSATDTTKLWGRAVGVSNVSNVGGTADATGQTTNLVSCNSGITFVAGALCRVGAIGDARGGGQFYAIASVATDDLTLLTNLPGAANSADVVYAPALIYPFEAAASESVTSMRFLIQSANQQYSCHGCWVSSISLSDLSPGQMPKVNFTVQVARWALSSATFPTTTSVETAAAAPVAAGSFFRQTNGTATRATDTVRDFSATIDLGTVPLMGPGATDAFQHIVGVTRTNCTLSAEFTTDAEAAGTQTFDDKWNTAEDTITYEHILYSLSCVDKRAVGIYLPKAFITGRRPVQSDVDGINRVRVSYKAKTSDDTTNALTNASWILGIG